MLRPWIKEVVSEVSLDAILGAIEELMGRGEFLAVFAKSYVGSLLPAVSRGSIRVFEILLQIVKGRPELVEGDFCKVFQQVAPHDPEKALTLLAIYARSFETLETPWGLLDQLFAQSRLFTKPALAERYAAVLVRLCADPEFVEARGEHSWTHLNALAASDDRAVVATAIRSLFAVSNTVTGDLPVRKLVEHIGDHEMSPLIVNFVLACSDRVQSCLLLDTLLGLAKHDERALYAVLSLEDQEEHARFLVVNTHWVKTALPHSVGTTRIVLGIARHASLRRSLVRVPALARRLAWTLRKPTMEGLVVVGLIVVKLKEFVTQRFVATLTRAGFFRGLVAAGEALDTEDADRVLYAVATVFTAVAYVPDLRNLWDLARAELEHNGVLSNEATALLVAACGLEEGRGFVLEWDREVPGLLPERRAAAERILAAARKGVHERSPSEETSEEESTLELS